MSVVHARGADRLRAKRLRPSSRAARSDGWARNSAVASVRRTRLERALDVAAKGPLTLVQGPAGTGKTTLVASWLRRSRVPVGWITLDQEHSDPGVFWAGIALALRRSGVLPRSAGVAGNSTPQTIAETVRAALLRHPAAVRLVIDDGHCAGGAELATLLGIARQSGLRLLVCSRTTPVVSLGRLRLDGELTEIGPTELAFVAAEATALLQSDGIRPAASEVDVLLDHTEGWAAGLRFASRAVREGRLSSVADFDGAVPEMIDYLNGEVLGTLTPSVRDFLLRTSADESVCVDLAEALTGTADAARILDQLGRDHLMAARVDSDGHWYRLPRLLRQCLAHQARIELAGDLPMLHLRSAEWWNGHGDPVEAIRHSVAAAAWRRAARLVVTVGAAELGGPRRDALHGHLAQLADVAGTTAEMAAALALLHADRRDVVAADRYQALGRAQLSTLPDGRQPPVAAALLLAAAMSARGRADHSTMHRTATALLSGAPAPDGGRAADGLRAMGAVHAGIALLWQADLGAAEKLLRTGLTLTQRHGLLRTASDALAHMALLCAAAGRLGEAVRLGQQSLRAAAELNRAPGPEVTSARLALALAAWQRGEDPDCHLDLADPGGPIPATSDLAAAVAIEVTRARIQSSAGRRSAARASLDRVLSLMDGWRPPALLADWIDAAGCALSLEESCSIGAPGTGFTPTTAWHTVATARSMLDRRDQARARASIAPLIAPRTAVGADVRTEAWLIEARAADSLGLSAAVGIALREALAAAVSERIVRPFRDRLLDVGPLLRRHPELVRTYTPFAAGLVADSEPIAESPRPSAEDAPPAEPMTDREAIVLRYLPTMLTAREIANELYVSPNTIKTQLKSIYRKLAVQSRRSAVDRARRIGWLST